MRFYFAFKSLKCDILHWPDLFSPSIIWEKSRLDQFIWICHAPTQCLSFNCVAIQVREPRSIENIKPLNCTFSIFVSANKTRRILYNQKTKIPTHFFSSLNGTPTHRLGCTCLEWTRRRDQFWVWTMWRTLTHSISFRKWWNYFLFCDDTNEKYHPHRLNKMIEREQTHRERGEGSEIQDKKEVN